MAAGSVEIVKAQISDASVVGFVHSAAWKQAYAEIFPAEYVHSDTPEKRTQEFLDACKNQDIFYYLIQEAGLAVGILKVMKQLDGYEILSLYILEEYRSNGIGKQAILQLSGQFGAETMQLWVLEDNKRGRLFYENIGFRSTGNTRVIDRGKPYVQVQYIKEAGY